MPDPLDRIPDHLRGLVHGDEFGVRVGFLKRTLLSTSSHLTFYARAVGEVYARSKWRGLMEATRQTTKVIWGFFISAGGLGLVGLYFKYVWPLLGKRWWAIVYLSVLVVILLALNGIVKTFHEQATKDLGDDLTAKRRQKVEDDKALSFQKDQTETARKLWRDGQEQMSALQAETTVLVSELARYTDHKIIPHVMRKLSNAHLCKWFQMPAVSAILGLKFENIASDEIALKTIKLRICERLDNGSVRELPIRGADPLVLHPRPPRSSFGLPPPASTFSNDPSAVEIEGFRIKPKDFSAEHYFFVSDQMAYPDYREQIMNDKHFLRLTVEAVAQKPYMIDIEVDWTEPGLWTLSSSPAFDEALMPLLLS